MSYEEKPDESLKVSESAFAYGLQGSLNPFYNLLGGVKALKLSNDFDIIKLIANILNIVWR